MGGMTAAFLRSVTTVHTTQIDAVLQEDFWRQLLDTWTFLSLEEESQGSTRLSAVISRLNVEAKEKMLQGRLFLLEDVDRPAPNECLISVNKETREVIIRIFGSFLTDVQSTSEWFVYKLITSNHFVITRHTRCFVVLNMQGERIDLTTGRVIPIKHRLWRDFYDKNRYSVNITASVFMISLFSFLTADYFDEHTAVGKVYSVIGRLLPVAMMNIFLHIGQFYSYRNTRKVIEWDKP